MQNHRVYIGCYNYSVFALISTLLNSLPDSRCKDYKNVLESKIEQWLVSSYTLLTDRLTDRQKDGQSQVSKVLNHFCIIMKSYLLSQPL